ncbi:MAG: hypothetical protein U1E17_04060 [Geminicoccaceae bacterium]
MLIEQATAKLKGWSRRLGRLWSLLGSTGQAPGLLAYRPSAYLRCCALVLRANALSCAATVRGACRS